MSLRGYHVKDLTAEAVESMRRARPAIVMSLDLSQDWRQLKAECGVSLLVARFWQDDHAWLSPNPIAAAERLYAEALPAILPLRDVVDIVASPWNERYQSPEEDLGAHAIACRRWCELAKRDGFQTGVGNFSMGRPEPEHMGLFAPALEQADYLIVHEYWLPGDLQQPWLAGRWRRLLDALPAALRRPIIIGECGVDTGQGYRAHLSDRYTVRHYVNDLDRYALSLDDRVAGLCVFNAGSRSAQWASWEIAGVPEIEQWVAAGPRTWNVPVPPAQPPQPPQPKPEKPTMPTVLLGGMTVLDVRDQFPYYGGRSYESRDRSAIRRVVMHHAAGGLAPPMTTEAALATLRSIHRWHTGETPGGNGWPAIGYHFGIDGEGRVYWLNGLELVTYHAREANADGIGVCWLGDYTKKAPSAAMIDAARTLYRALEKHLGRSLTLQGHKEAMTEWTECPGAHWATTKPTMLRSTTVPEEPTKPAILPYLDDLWGVANDLDAQAAKLKERADRIKAQIVAIKQKAGIA